MSPVEANLQNERRKLLLCDLARPVGSPLGLFTPAVIIDSCWRTQCRKENYDEKIKV